MWLVFNPVRVMYVAKLAEAIWLEHHHHGDNEKGHWTDYFLLPCSGKSLGTRLTKWCHEMYHFSYKFVVLDADCWAMLPLSKNVLERCRQCECSNHNGFRDSSDIFMFTWNTCSNTVGFCIGTVTLYFWYSWLLCSIVYYHMYCI